MAKKKITRRKTKPSEHNYLDRTAAPVKKETVHYTASYLIDPPHPVTINLVGCGGTGSQVLNSLARMNSALKALRHPGLYVRAFDPDKVSEANMGRQLFSSTDVGSYKCVVLVGRINRFFGTSWDAVPLTFASGKGIAGANITISCVDTASARKEIKKMVHTNMEKHDEPYYKTYYWMDYGNTMDRGQVVIGTARSITQPKEGLFNTQDRLPSIDHLHPDILKEVKGEDQGPSCSLAEALQKQDLFINTNLANAGLGILWQMFRQAYTRYHGLYINLSTLTTTPIKVKA